MSNIEPATRHGRWLIESVRFAALAVAVVGAARLVATAVRRPGHRPQDQAKVEELLAGWATSSLAPFQLLDDKSWFFAGDEAFVGYKVLGTTAVALGEPIGRPDSQRLAVAAFVEFCEGNGWTPAFHQVTAHGVELGRAAGLRSLKVGEEAIIDLDTWDLDAKHNKGLRSALRRVERAGAHLVELQRPLDEPTLNELSEVSDAWLADSGHRERTFSLGRFDRDTLRRTPVLAVREAGDDTAPGRILAFANVLPSYQSLEGNFDLMRRRPDAPNGVMETLFVGLIDRFRGEGKKGMNLGLAPLSGIEGNSLAERALRRLYERGGLAFNYGGLRRYKEKWQPRWEPRYLLYHAETDLARVAAAVARAGELPDPRSLTSRLLGVVRRFPVTVALLTLLAWLMAATAIDPSLHHELLRQFGLAWHDLQRLQLWRLPTSQLIQAHSGWGWNLLAALVVLTLAERRLGSARTLTVFFVADWGSTGAILLALRIAAALGNTMAADTISRRDGGVSSALYALGTVLAASLWPGRTRRVALAAAAAVIVGPLLANHNLAAAQHLGAALVALGIWWRWQPHSKRGPDIATADRSSSIDTQAARP